MTTDFVTRADQLESSGTPLRRFWAEFHDYEIKLDSRQEGRYQVDLNFTNVELIAYPDDHKTYPGEPGSVTPYTYPVCQLNLRYNKTRSGGVSDRGGWGMFLKSIEELGFLDLVESKGAVWLMEAEPNYVYNPDRNPDEDEIKGMVWTAVETRSESPSNVFNAQSSDEDGGLNADELAHLLELIDGKDSSEFSQAALQDPVGRKVQSSIFNNTLIAGWIDKGLIVQEGETFKVVPTDV